MSLMEATFNMKVRLTIEYIMEILYVILKNFYY